MGERRATKVLLTLCGLGEQPPLAAAYPLERAPRAFADFGAGALSRLAVAFS